MRVLVLPADNAGCGNYRLIMAAEHLRTQGHDIHIGMPQTDQAGFSVLMDEDTMIDFKLPVDDVDVIVMQRISHHLHVQSVPLLREKGIAVVVDMDDDLTCIHPRNLAFWNYRTRSASPFTGKNATQVCKDATLVTVSTKPLLNVYARHGRGQVIDNYVPERYLYVNLPKEEPVFGWAGTLKSHPVDLAVCGRAVRELVDQGYRFKVVGPADKDLVPALKLAAVPDATGVSDMFGWPAALSHLDVGMAPLEMSTFNTSKSRLKVLEYGSIGIPAVASPRAEYRRFHKESGGAGILAETPKEWAAGIKKLMDDESMRKEMSEQVRAFAATQTIEKHSWRWLEAWTRAYEIQRGQS